ncbi:hypothetical protein CHH55_23910 [Niallia circulans]|uniref:DUF4176 domain-containing protein n=1 Tax=Niallia circulans TaxID=1397 RepID=UPI000BA72FBC|nr:DUF4176 domain-containing protein [Niallia circulans]PAD85364.1 hypothetical protein CHH55_23910 [Niallia circulans]
MNDRKQLKALAMKKIAQLMDSLSDESKGKYRAAIHAFADLYLEDELVFRELYFAYKQGLRSYDIKSTNQEAIYYRKEDKEHVIQFRQSHYCLQDHLFFPFVTSCIEIMREVLPLGSVVELNPLYFLPEQQTSSAAKIVITKRYTVPTGYQTFFPYGGVVYPVGEMKKDAILYFTEPLITNVIHMGFKDEMEEAFELLMKEELVVEKKMTSIEFSAQDMQSLQVEMERAGER